MKKVKNETGATFSYVYEELASKFCHFSHLSSKMKVNHAFKAKKEAFRERFCAKVENDSILLHLTLQNLERDESQFLMKIFKT